MKLFIWHHVANCDYGLMTITVLAESKEQAISIIQSSNIPEWRKACFVRWMTSKKPIEVESDKAFYHVS